LYADALEATGRRRWLSYGGSFVAALLALGAKEAGISVVLLIAGFHVLIAEPDLLRVPRVPWSLAPFAAIPVVYFPLRAALVGNLSEGSSTDFGPDILTNVHRFSTIAIDPFFNEPLPHFTYTMGEGAVASLLIGLTAVAVALGSNRERFCAWWYYVALGPFLLLKWVFVIGRYLYLPVVGLALLAGLVAGRLWEGLPRASAPYARPATAALVIGVAVWFGMLNARHQDSLNAHGEEARAFVEEVKAVYPTLPDGAVLVVSDFPRTLSFGCCDGFMMRPALRLAYGDGVQVFAYAQFIPEVVAQDLLPSRDLLFFYPPQSRPDAP
jgi:hypothetical protein